MRKLTLSVLLVDAFLSSKRRQTAKWPLNAAVHKGLLPPWRFYKNSVVSKCLRLSVAVDTSSSFTCTQQMNSIDRLHVVEKATVMRLFVQLLILGVAVVRLLPFSSGCSCNLVNMTFIHQAVAFAFNLWAQMVIGVGKLGLCSGQRFQLF